MDWSRRRIEILDLMHLRLGDPLALIILLRLDTLLGDWPSIDRTVDEVMDLCELKRTAFYQRLNHLKALGFVAADDLPGTTKKRWRLGRANLAEAARHQGRAGVITTDEPPPPPVAPVRHADDGVRQADNPVRNTDGFVRQADSFVRHADEVVRHADGYTNIRARDFCHFGELRSASSATARPYEEWAAAAAALVESGVDWAVDAIDAARSRGCTPDHVLAIVAHFRRHAAANGWSAAALQRRVSKALPGIPPELGAWPKRARPASPRDELTDLEGQHGTELEALSPAALQVLARGALAGQPGLWQLFTMHRDGEKTRDPRIRRRLLAALATQPVAEAVR